MFVVYPRDGGVCAWAPRGLLARGSCGQWRGHIHTGPAGMAPPSPLMARLCRQLVWDITEMCYLLSWGYIYRTWINLITLLLFTFEVWFWKRSFFSTIAAILCHQRLVSNCELMVLLSCLLTFPQHTGLAADPKRTVWASQRLQHHPGRCSNYRAQLQSRVHGCRWGQTSWWAEAQA